MELETTRKGIFGGCVQLFVVERAASHCSCTSSLRNFCQFSFSSVELSYSFEMIRRFCLLFSSIVPMPQVSCSICHRSSMTKVSIAKNEILTIVTDLTYTRLLL